MASTNERKKRKWYQMLIKEFVRGIVSDGAKRTFQLIINNYIHGKDSNSPYFSWIRNFYIRKEMKQKKSGCAYGYEFMVLGFNFEMYYIVLKYIVMLFYEVDFFVIR